MSVLRINQNPIAINANRHLNNTSTNIARSLEKLASGLRINRAADDAAGLSISEKLRGQIRGVKRASMNALDGISLIQTAEGALNEIHNILQRVRELAVQSANGIYTANDRATLQLEVNQLTEEIDRISQTTEFNSKTLLDGTMSALISTDDYTKIRAAVIGDVGNGGNFVMRSVALEKGQLQVQKTDVFSVTLDKDAVGQINYLNTFRANAIIGSAGPDGIGNTGIYQAAIRMVPEGSVAVNSTSDGTFRISDVQGSTAAHTIGQNFQAEELSVGDKILLTVNSPTGVRTVSVAFLSMMTTNATLATQLSTALSGMATGVGFNAGAGNNFFSITLGAGVSIVNTQFVDVDGSGSDYNISFGSTGISNRFFASITVSFFNNGNTFTAVRSSGPGNTGEYFHVGDLTTGNFAFRFDTRYDWSAVSLAGATATDTITWSRTNGTNSLQETGKVWQVGAVPNNFTFLVSAVSERTYAVFSFSNSTYTDLVAQGWDQGAAVAAARGAQLGVETSISATFDGTGTILENVRLTFDGILQAGETATFNMSTSNVLTADQLNTLASLSRFQEFGVFNGKNNVELELYLRGQDASATINLSSNDTFEEMAGKISLALWNPLGTGLINSSILNPDFMPDLVHVNTIGAAKGTMSIVTPVPGTELVLSGDEALLKALSLVETREEKSAVYSISAFNLELNKSIGSVRTDTNEINGLLQGIRVYFDNTLGLRLDPQPPTNIDNGFNTMTTFAYPMAIERPEISISGEIETFFMHVAPRGFSLQTGANQGQRIEGAISDTSSLALGLEGILLITKDLAEEAISIVDEAIDRVSQQRSKLGAMQNRLESTIRNLDVTAENLTASESRIRDVDIAMETLVSTRNQILLQSGVAALAQANQLPQAVLQLLR